jgi:3-oxoacyl-[acyl-carrier-protein] synthase-1
VRKVYIAADNIISPLGFTTGENAASLKAGEKGIHEISDPELSPVPFHASVIDTTRLDERFSEEGDPEEFTRFEKMAVLSLRDACSRTDADLRGARTLFILSTTKGNIDLLASSPSDERLYLWQTAGMLGSYFGFGYKPLVISDACISGVQAIITGARMIRAGLYDNVVINGTDIISEFVVSGFSAFKSLSQGPCMPFDKRRDGLSLGEGSGTIILTADPSLAADPKIIAGEGFSTNDANHISGPSRTGEGLWLAISSLLSRTGGKISYISAHGTATPYNDEMESIAITRAGLQDVPVNSFKGYWGHTLGAAGIIESVMGIHSVRNGILFRTEGFSEPGTTNPLNIIARTENKQIMNCLKIASGFGGCNAVQLFSRE